MYFLLFSAAFLSSFAVFENALADIISPGNITGVEKDMVVFNWRSTGSRILEVKWGIASGSIPNPQFISVRLGSAPKESSDLNVSALSYKGRVSFSGDLNAGQAFFKIENLKLSDSGLYIATIREDTKLVSSPFYARLTVSPVSTTPTPTSSPTTTPTTTPDSTTPLPTTTLTPTTSPPTPSCRCKDLDTYKALVIFHVNWIFVSNENRKEWLISKIRILFRNEPTFHDVCGEMEEKSGGVSVFTLTFCFKKEVTKEYVKEEFEAFRNTVKLNVTISQLSIQVKGPEISKTPVPWWIILLIGICVIVVLAVVIVIICYRCCPERLQDCCTSICRCCPKCFLHEGTPPPQPDKDEETPPPDKDKGTPPPDKDEETPPPNKEGIPMKSTSVARG